MTPASRCLAPLVVPPSPLSTPRFGKRLMRLLGLWLLSSVVWVLAHAAEAIKKSFDLPEDAIETSLKRFSAQSGLEVLFPTDAVAGLRTQSVRGEMTSRQALDGMLAGTGFGVFQDPKSGALTVTKNSNRDGNRRSRPAAAESRRESLKQDQIKTLPPIQEPMKRNKLLTRLAATLALFIAPAAHSAESAGSIEGRVLNATSGQYVKNARITVEGTTVETLSGEFGEYRLSGLPTGVVVVKAAYGGLPPITERLNISSGQTRQHDFVIGSTSQTTLREGEMVKLDEFIVSSARETNAAAIATNEQRYAPNIKNVVSSDAFGDVTEGNVGEFLKYLPGITVDYTAGDVRTISVRGFADTFTGVSVDGGRMASAASGGSDRVFELEQVSINNVARVEVTKVPTPEMPADGLGGSVNMVSRSAFEQSRPQFRYKMNLSVHNENRSDILRKTPGPGDKKTFKSLPGFDFNYIAPLSKTFGIVVNGLVSNQFNEQHRSNPTWNFNNAAAGSTASTPYLRNYSMQDGPKNSHRSSIAVTTDWKPAPKHVVSIRGQANYYRAFFGNRNINYGVGTNPKPTPATGTPLMFSPTFTQSATGRGTVTQGGSFRDKFGATTAINMTHRFNGQLWSTESGVNASRSRTWYRDLTEGHFQSVATRITNVGTVRYDDITYPRPGTITVRDANGSLIDTHDLTNYRINTVRTRPTDGEAFNKGAYTKIKRSFYIRGLSFAMKTGAAIRSEDRDNRRYNETYTFVGADGVANTVDDSAAAFLDTQYSSVDPYWGFQPIQWADAYKLAQLYRSNPSYFVPTTKQAVKNEKDRINGSEKIREVITAGFLQGESNLFRNRLRIVTGVRYEKTEDTGEGPLFDPDAPFQRDAGGRFMFVNGARVRKPEAGAPNSLEELALTNKERAARASRSYDGFFPSFHASFNITENLLARFSYAKTFGRPNFGDIIPNTIINEDESLMLEPDPTALPGVITVRNPGLRPWMAKNYDLSLEYYFQKGGLISVSGFQKNVSNFWNSLTEILTPELANEHDVDPLYVGWELRSKTNGGDAKISGLELNYNQPLAFIPRFGQFFSLSANMTRLHLEGSRDADFARFIPRSGNVGLTFNRRPLNIKVNLNYRGQQKLSTQSSISGFRFYNPRKYIDVNLEYRLSRRATLFLNGRNVTNVPQEQVNIGVNPAYSQQFRVEEFGVQWAVGIKGTF